jgi:tRNA-splicing ligase RtcB
MGSPSFRVEGRGHEPALCSSAHSAGRALSRTAARARVTERDLVKVIRVLRPVLNYKGL